MLNFTVGPVMASDEVRAIGAEQVPYFRTAEFSAIMKENEQLMKKFAKASDDARTVFHRFGHSLYGSCGHECVHSCRQGTGSEWR